MGALDSRHLTQVTYVYVEVASYTRATVWTFSLVTLLPRIFGRLSMVVPHCGDRIFSYCTLLAHRTPAQHIRLSFPTANFGKTVF